MSRDRLNWDKAREARLIKAWNSGLTASALGERFGTSAECITQKIFTLRAAGVDLRQGENSRGRAENMRRRQLMRLRLLGLNAGLSFEGMAP